MDEKEIICKCSWFDSKRHRKSHTDMYYKELKDTLWVFDSCDYKNGLARVEVIKVSKNTNEYDSAVNNSNISKKKDDEEEKLYSWVSELREKFKKGILEEEYIKQLELIPLWKWEEEK